MYIVILTEVEYSLEALMYHNALGLKTAAYPVAVVIPKERVANADSLIENADAVLFKPDSIGHKEVYKTKSIISRKQIPFSYIGDIANLKLLEKNVYEELKKLGF